MSTRLSYQIKGGTISLTSNDPKIKQVFFGYGSWGTGMGIREYPEFYGRSIDYGRAISPDHEMWQWDLTDELVRYLHTRLQRDGEEDEAATSYVIRTLENIINGVPEQTVDDFTLGYIHASLWHSTDADDRPLKDSFGPLDISDSAWTNIRTDCETFQRENAELLSTAYSQYCRSPVYSVQEQAGHDFWLTRVGSGAGFMDRDLGETGELLSKACKRFGERWIYVGDDRKLYGF